MSAVPISAAAGGVRLAVRVIPRASRSEISGLRDGRLVVRVTAAPVDGAANEAVIALLARTLGVARRALTVVTGETHREKIVVIAGVTEADARRILRV